MFKFRGEPYGGIHPRGGGDDEVRMLRQEVAGLRADLAEYRKTGSATPPAAEKTSDAALILGITWEGVPLSQADLMAGIKNGESPAMIFSRIHVDRWTPAGHVIRDTVLRSLAEADRTRLSTDGVIRTEADLQAAISRERNPNPEGLSTDGVIRNEADIAAAVERAKGRIH